VAVSIVVPLFDEEESVDELVRRLRELEPDIPRLEIVLVDDGSADGTWPKIREAAEGAESVVAVRLARNFGQTAALSAGITASRGEIVVLMDGDLQNDPSDVPRLVAKLEEGYDVVSGWRRHRHDKLVTRKIPSWIANRVISRLSGVHLHDYGCTLKAYRRRVIGPVKLYGEMHRFIPIYAAWEGARITEMEVTHHARKAGRSKYGLNRTVKVLLDLFVIKFLGQYAVKPIYVFGGFGCLSFVLAFLAGLWALYWKFLADKKKSFIETPLPVLVVFLALVGFVSLLMGLLAEMASRTYFESQGKPPYVVAESAGREDDAD
jgi:glycosyltransferase involved in cell wall biosynthesis